MKQFFALIFALCILAGCNSVTISKEQKNDKEKIHAAFLKLYQENPSLSNDSLEIVNHFLSKQFSAYLNKYPSSINEDFPDFGPLQYATSRDHTLRLYAWNTQMGGHYG